jgi:hypothetical protein
MTKSLFLVMSLAVTMVSSAGRADSVKTLYMEESTVAQVPVSTKGMVLSFPTKPSKVILGNGSSFSVEYVENDIAITPMSIHSRANLFVYMLGRRFSFDLITSPSAGNAIVMVRDQIEMLPTPKPEKVPVKSGRLNGRAKP